MGTHSDIWGIITQGYLLILKELSSVTRERLPLIPMMPILGLVHCISLFSSEKKKFHPYACWFSIKQVSIFYQEALCDLLDQGGKETLQIAACREASEKSPRAFWAFRRLGYLQVSFLFSHFPMYFKCS